MSDRQQRVTLDGLCSEWEEVGAGVPQGSILGPILFLLYINDIVEVVESDIKIFADDTFIFRIVDQYSTDILNSDLQKINEWATLWKMSFNPDISKQAVEVFFSKKQKKSILDPLVFNNIPVKKVEETRHLGMILDSKLSFESHLNEKLAKASSSLGLMIQLKKWVSMPVLETVYKLFVRSGLDYCDVVYHKANLGKNKDVFNSFSHNNLMNKVESIQYRAARIITGAWNGSGKGKLYKMLGWETLNDRRILKKQIIIYETLKNKFPRYLYSILQKQQFRLTSRHFESKLKNIPGGKVYQASFFPSAISDWNNLDQETKNAKSKNIFKNKLLNKIRPKKQPFYGLSNNRIRLLTMLRVDLSPLNQHKFHYNFSDTRDESCNSCGVSEDTEHYLLHCPSMRLTRNTRDQKISIILKTNFSTLPKSTKLSYLLYGNDKLNTVQNNQILNVVAEYIEKSKRLDKM